jgi:glucan phosphorylase
MPNHQNEFPNLPERIGGLADFAENLWWSWNPDARTLFKMLDRPAWKESMYKPDKMLRELPTEKTAGPWSMKKLMGIAIRRTLVKYTGCW